jgi:hypothetical protein
MHYERLREMLWLREQGVPKMASPKGLLSPENLSQYTGDVPYRSENPLLRGIPATSSRTSPPLVVTMGTSGV